MAYKTKWKTKKVGKYKVGVGRTIYAEKGDGKELFSINTEEGYSPTETDAMAHYLADKLNKDKDFPKYYKKYMEK